jgi:hypothetical protein
VVPDLKAFGQAADSGLLAVRQAAERQQQQILLGFEADRPSIPLGPIQEASDLIAKLSQRLVNAKGDAAAHQENTLS